MLPKVNGYEICRAVRAHGIEVPILMLTAKGQEQDVILGLNLGADDYITKPFRMGELIARTRAFLRRRGPAPTTFRFGDCEVDLAARKVRRAGADVDLTAKERKDRPYEVRKDRPASSERTDPTRFERTALREPQFGHFQPSAIRWTDLTFRTRFRSNSR
jgi:response regulator RpfG family c-di-GMP phosphodiesterase